MIGRWLFSQFRRIWRGFVNRYTVAACLCLVAVAVNMEYRVASGFSYLPLSGVGIALAVLYLVLLTKWLATKGERDRLVWRSVRWAERIAMLFVWAFLIYSGFVFANGRLDVSEPRDRASEIVDIVATDLDVGELIPVSWVTLKSWETSGTTTRLYLKGWERVMLWPGLGVIVKVREGAFGVPWVSRIERDKDRYALAVLQVSPTASSAWKTLIVSHIEHRRWDEAAQAADRYLKLYPNAYDFALYVGGSLVNAARFDAGIPILERVVSGRPNNYNAYQLLGWALTHHGQVQRGIDILRASISLRPDDYEVYYHLGFSYLTAGQPEEAVPMLEKALELRPTFPEVQEQLAKLRKAPSSNQKT